MRRWLPLSAVLLCLAVGSAHAGILPAEPQPAAVSVLPDDPAASGHPGQNPPVPAPPTRANRESLPQINQREADQSDDQENPAVFSHHLIADRIWISGQANFIFQAHEPFHSPYSGTNSFQSRVETTALSRVLTLYTGVKLTRWFEFIFNAEEAGGKGLSEALGIAAFTNLDVVRNPSLGQDVYAARYFIHYTLPLNAGPGRRTAQPLLSAEVDSPAAD